MAMGDEMGELIDELARALQTLLSNEYQNIGHSNDELADASAALDAYHRRTPTAREPVKVTEAMVDRAVATFEAGMGEAQCEATDASFRALMRKTLTAALSAHHPEVQPAEPMARHWRDGDRVQWTNMIGYTFTGTLRMNATVHFDDNGGWRNFAPSELNQLRELDEQRARELAERNAREPQMSGNGAVGTVIDPAPK
jgi:hypothetical protein